MSSARQTLFWKQLKEVTVIIGGGLGLFSGFNIYEGNERFYGEIMMPCMKYLDPETTHHFAIFLAKHRMVPKQKIPDPPCLHTKLWNKEFPNPVGIAAGFDKDGVAIDGMLQTGFGFVEVGSITPKPQPGNPKPRLFRLWEDKAVINRFGFNSEGHDVVRERLKQRLLAKQLYDVNYVPYIAEQRNMLNLNFWMDTDYLVTSDSTTGKRKNPGLVGVNLGKNKTSKSPITDYVEGVQKFGGLADYLVINVSSPNTPGLRDMQGKEQLDALVEKVSNERNKLVLHPKPPLLVKISPDLTQKDKQDIADVILKVPGRIDGLVVSNTTVTRPQSLTSKYKNEQGGLSGEPLKLIATQTIKDMYLLTQGKIPIIGVGGISSGQDAYDKIRAGASLVQLYSALVYQGPPVIKRIKRELQELLAKDGFTNISEAVGSDVKNWMDHESHDI